MSKRCDALIRQGRTEGRSHLDVDKSTFDAFVDVCNMCSFKVTPTNVFQLLNLAQEWQVSTLEKFCNKFINDKGLEPPAPEDPIQNLLSKIASDAEDTADIIPVSNIINEALLDHRLLELSPEILFEIVLRADPKTIDDKKLINFILDLFEVKPSSAVPLLLLMDFDEATNAQRGGIFRNRKTHEINIGFFVGWEMSDARNRAEKALKEVCDKFKSRLASMKQSGAKQEKAGTKKLKKAVDMAMEGLKKEISDNQRKINDLISMAELEAKEFAREEEQYEEQLDQMRKEIDKVKVDCDYVADHTNSQTEEVNRAVMEAVDAIRKDLHSRVNGMVRETQAKCQTIKEEQAAIIEEQTAAIDDMFTKVKELNDTEESLSDEIQMLKSTLLSKIIRDRIRCDKFIRESEQRFDMFNCDRPPWRMTVAKAHNSEEFILELERRLDELCPIRGGTQQGSPKKATPKPAARRGPITPIEIHTSDVLNGRTGSSGAQVPLLEASSSD